MTFAASEKLPLDELISKYQEPTPIAKAGVAGADKTMKCYYHDGDEGKDKETLCDPGATMCMTLNTTEKGELNQIKGCFRDAYAKEAVKAYSNGKEEYDGPGCYANNALYYDVLIHSFCICEGSLCNTASSLSTSIICFFISLLIYSISK